MEDICFLDNVLQRIIVYSVGLCFKSFFYYISDFLLASVAELGGMLIECIYATSQFVRREFTY